jgi:hypothetical protein
MDADVLASALGQRRNRRLEIGNLLGDVVSGVHLDDGDGFHRREIGDQVDNLPGDGDAKLIHRLLI